MSCVIAAAVLLVAGYAYHVEGQLGGIESSNALSGGPQTGEMNILLMGLERRHRYAPASTVTVDVYNGSGAPGLAGGVSQALVSKGYKGGAVKNAAEQPHQVQPATQVFYNAAATANAAKIAGYFSATASASTSLPAGHVEVLLGTSVTAMPAGLGSPGARHPRQRRRRPGTTARLPGR